VFILLLFTSCYLNFLHFSLSLAFFSLFAFSFFLWRCLPFSKLGLSPKEHLIITVHHDWLILHTISIIFCTSLSSFSFLSFVIFILFYLLSSHIFHSTYSYPSRLRSLWRCVGLTIPALPSSAGQPFPMPHIYLASTYLSCIFIPIHHFRVSSRSCQLIFTTVYHFHSPNINVG
jgi:hypothetical protein